MRNRDGGQIVYQQFGRDFAARDRFDVLVGGGAGLWIDVQKYVALIVDVSVLGAIAAGDGQQSGMNIDVSLGVGVHF